MAWLAVSASRRSQLECVSRTAIEEVRARRFWVITGGLGGLGLRAAVLVAQSGASSVFLASRSGVCDSTCCRVACLDRA